MLMQTILQERGVEFEVLEHHPTYSAQRLAEDLHVPGKEVAKTVLLRATDDKQVDYVVAVLPATRSIDFAKASKLLDGRKVEMATEVELAERCPDCEMGVLPPFGSYYGMQTVVDQTLAEDDKIVFEGGTHHDAIRMAYQHFIQTEQPDVGDFVHR